MPKTELATITIVQMSVQALLTPPLSKRTGTSVASRNWMLTIGFCMMMAADAVFALPMFAYRWGEQTNKQCVCVIDCRHVAGSVSIGTAHGNDTQHNAGHDWIIHANWQGGRGWSAHWHCLVIH